MISHSGRARVSRTWPQESFYMGHIMEFYIAVTRKLVAHGHTYHFEWDTSEGSAVCSGERLSQPQCVAWTLYMCHMTHVHFAVG